MSLLAKKRDKSLYFPPFLFRLCGSCYLGFPRSVTTIGTPADLNKFMAWVWGGGISITIMEALDRRKIIREGGNEKKPRGKIWPWAKSTGGQRRSKVVKSASLSPGRRGTTSKSTAGVHIMGCDVFRRGVCQNLLWAVSLLRDKLRHMLAINFEVWKCTLHFESIFIHIRIASCAENMSVWGEGGGLDQDLD